MSRIAIRLDAGAEIGYGHLRRGMILAEALQKKGHTVAFVCKENTDAVRRLRAARWEVQEFEATPVRTEAAGVESIKNEDEMRAIFSLAARLIILDVRDTGHPYVAALKEAGMRVLTFDDLGDGRYLADLVVDANLLEKTNPLKMKTPTRYLLGPDYAILSPVVHRWWTAWRPVRRRLTQIVVSCGGTDPAGATAVAVSGLARLEPEVVVDVVLGGGFATRKRLDSALAGAPREFKIHQDVPDLGLYLRQADLGIISGGITLFEAASAGLPCLVIAQNKHQLANVSAFEEVGGAHSLGLASNLNPEDILQAVRDHSSSKKRAAMRRAMTRLVDGQGLSRVVGEIERVLS